MADDDENRPLHPRILLFSNLLVGYSIIVLALTFYLLFSIFNGRYFLGTGKIFVIICFILNIILQCVDVVAWFYIKKQTKFNHEKAAQYLIFPILADVFMIFIFSTNDFFQTCYLY